VASWLAALNANRSGACLDDDSSQGRRVFTGVALEPTALLVGSDLLVATQVGQWDASLGTAASAIAATLLSVDSATSLLIPATSTPLVLPFTKCGGDGTAHAADRVQGLRAALAGKQVVAAANLIYLPSLLSGKTQETHDIGLLSLRKHDHPVHLAAGQVLEDLVAISDRTLLMVSRNDAATQRFLWRIDADTLLPENQPVSLSVDGARARFVSSATGDATWFLTVQALDGSGDGLIAAVSTTVGRAWTLLENPRKADFQPNPYIQANGRGTYWTRDTSALDLGNRYQPSDVGAQSKDIKSFTLVNHTARLYPGLGRPRFAAQTGLLVAVGADARASQRKVAVSYWTCHSADIQPECRPISTSSGVCVPDMTVLPSACRWVSAPLDQAILMTSTNDGQTWSTPLIVDPDAAQTGDQTVALAVAIQGSWAAMLYERWEGNSAAHATLRVALIDLSGASPRSTPLVIHAYNARRQAYVEGIFDGGHASIVPLGETAARFLVAFSRVSMDLLLPDAPISTPAAGTLQVDRYDRSRLGVVLIGEGE
jgi:hypothetical protein